MQQHSRTLRIATAAVVALGAASVAPLRAQAPQKTSRTDTSHTRIKIVKESPTEHAAAGIIVSHGEVGLSAVCPVCQDSVEHMAAQLHAVRLEIDHARYVQHSVDSMELVQRLRQADEQAHANFAAALTAERHRAEARADSIEAARQASLRAQLARGFYAGIGGGASAPQRDIRNGYTGGWNLTLPVGWDATRLPLGVRADFAIDRLNGTHLHDDQNDIRSVSGPLTVWSVNTDLKLRLPAPGASSRTHLYVLGGIGASRVANGVFGYTGPDAGKNVTFGDAGTKFGWNTGAGASFAWGQRDLFVESRFFQVKTDLPYHTSGGVGTYTSFTPIVVGLTWF